MKQHAIKPYSKLGKISIPAYRETFKNKDEELAAKHMHIEEKQETSSLSHQYMTPQDLENELGLSLSQQYKLRSARFREENAKKGGFNLPYIKQMGLIVYDRDDVIKWLTLNKKN